MKKIGFTLLVLFTVLLSEPVKASHINGGTMWYTYLGNDQYRISFELYIECSYPWNNPTLALAVYDMDSPGTRIELEANLVADDTIPFNNTNPCLTIPDGICLTRKLFEVVVTLPFNQSGYTVAYWNCCMISGIANLNSSDDWGYQLTSFIPGTDIVSTQNSSAFFTGLPPLLACTNLNNQIANAFSDPDGDSLVVELATPFVVDIFSWSLDYAPPPPYTLLTWEPGYTATQPFGSTSTSTINATTGSMIINPAMVGTYIYALVIKEYRNGVLINETIRSFLLRTVDCLNAAPEVSVSIIGNTNADGTGLLIEGCDSLKVIYWLDNLQDTLQGSASFSGTALQNVDFTVTNPSMLFTPQQPCDTFLITGILDSELQELTENAQLLLQLPIACSQSIDTTVVNFELQNYVKPAISGNPQYFFCEQSTPYLTVSVGVANGLPNYWYNWNGGIATNLNSITIPTSGLSSPTNYTVVVTDFCNNSDSIQIQLNNNCQLVIPNIITANGDGVNDLFSLQNWNPSLTVSLKIVNRWGNVVYENNDYQNNWKGNDISGKQLSEGVYFYTITQLVPGIDVPYQYQGFLQLTF